MWGDKVYLGLRDYYQQSVHIRATKKLTKRFFGPFEIIERIRPVAYRLALPSRSRIHLVFHVPLLRQAFGNIEPTPLPEFFFFEEPPQQELEDDLLVKEGEVDKDHGINTTNPTAGNQWRNVGPRESLKGQPVLWMGKPRSSHRTMHSFRTRTGSFLLSQ
ncbi:uncharacterized protein LOC111911772 [Lactuca sativa]|uniref:uncharacterized protein LOC111911772 n=1 Tax=Lactuca sativa TaxID=4236 RepID=UPI000CD7FB6A|nr:uncharacterized protein LOC111911772 [Lactuca sativa]